MSLRRLDKSKPPPYWFQAEGHPHVVLTDEIEDSVEAAHKRAAQLAQPYIDDALARLVEWLRLFAESSPEVVADDHEMAQRLAGYVKGMHAELVRPIVKAMANAIEKGEWRND